MISWICDQSIEYHLHTHPQTNFEINVLYQPERKPCKSSALHEHWLKVMWDKVRSGELHKRNKIPRYLSKNKYQLVMVNGMDLIYSVTKLGTWCRYVRSQTWQLTQMCKLEHPPVHPSSMNNPISFPLSWCYGWPFWWYLDHSRYKFRPVPLQVLTTFMIGRSSEFNWFKEQVQQKEINWESKNTRHQGSPFVIDSHPNTFPRQLQSLAVV